MSIGVGSRVSFTANSDPNGGIHGAVKSMNLSVSVPVATGKGGLNLSTNSTGCSVLWDGSVSQQQLVPIADLTQQNS